MKKLLLKLFLLTSLFISAQNKNGNLLLLKIDKVRDLKIDNEQTQYVVLELDSNYKLINDSRLSKPVYFKDFTDKNLFLCAKRDSISLKTLMKDDTFDHDNNLGLKNFKMIESNSDKMNHLMNLNIESSLYNQKIKVSYTFINCNYCIGTITKYDSKFINYTGEIVLIIDDLIINNKNKISNENLDFIVKSIDFNSHLFR